MTFTGGNVVVVDGAVVVGGVVAGVVTGAAVVSSGTDAGAKVVTGAAVVAEPDLLPVRLTVVDVASTTSVVVVVVASATVVVDVLVGLSLAIVLEVSGSTVLTALWSTGNVEPSSLEQPIMTAAPIAPTIKSRANCDFLLIVPALIQQ